MYDKIHYKKKKNLDTLKKKKNQSTVLTTITKSNEWA